MDNRYDYIQSKDYRKILEENHVEISDWNLASLVYHDDKLTFDERNKILKELCLSTTDKVLKQQIEARFQKDKRMLESFCKENPLCYYELVINGERDESIYKSFSQAYKGGISCGLRFSIIKEYFCEFDEVKDENNFLGAIFFNENGTLLSELNLYPARCMTYPKHDCFEDRYIDLPYFFRQGEIVKILGSEQYGIVSCFSSDSDEKEYISLAKSGDYSDFCVTVDLYFDGFKFKNVLSHVHISPTEIEYATFKNDDKRRAFLEYVSKELYCSSLSENEKYKEIMTFILRLRKSIY